MLAEFKRLLVDKLFRVKIDLIESYDKPLESTIALRADSLADHIYETRLGTSRQLLKYDALVLALRCTLAEVAIWAKLKSFGYQARWASEHQAFTGPYDITVESPNLLIDLKCGDPGSTITMTQSEYDKIINSKEHDVYHLRCDWAGRYEIMPTHFYRVRDQVWHPSKKNSQLELYKRSYYAQQRQLK